MTSATPTSATPTSATSSLIVYQNTVRIVVVGWLHIDEIVDEDISFNLLYSVDLDQFTMFSDQIISCFQESYFSDNI